jgi:hypothetical protein
MDAAMETRPAGAFSAFLAGLQAGMVGVLWMLAWLGISAKWQVRSFWTSENLMASVFYGDEAIRSGFAARTLSGLALYLLIYSLLGALVAMMVRDRLSRTGVTLVSVAVALGWYYLSFHVIWRAVSPLITLLHVERATIIGHLLYGTLLGRYPVYLPRAVTPPTPVDAAPPAESTHEEIPREGGAEVS